MWKLHSIHISLGLRFSPVLILSGVLHLDVITCAHISKLQGRPEPIGCKLLVHFRGFWDSCEDHFVFESTVYICLYQVVTPTYVIRDEILSFRRDIQECNVKIAETDTGMHSPCHSFTPGIAISTNYDTTLVSTHKLWLSSRLYRLYNFCGGNAIPRTFTVLMPIHLSRSNLLVAHSVFALNGFADKQIECTELLSGKRRSSRSSMGSSSPYQWNQASLLGLTCRQNERAFQNQNVLLFMRSYNVNRIIVYSLLLQCHRDGSSLTQH